MEPERRPRLSSLSDVVGIRRTEEVRRQRLERMEENAGTPLARAETVAGVIAILLIVVVVVLNIVR